MRNLINELNRLTRVTKAYLLGDQLEAIVTELHDVRAKYTALLADVTAGRSAGRVTNNAGLVIKAGSSAIVKAGTAFAAMFNGVPVVKAANTDMAALVGTLATAKTAIWAFYIDAAGTLTASAKTADAADVASALALFPATPATKALIGFITVVNASGAPFVGGTTALDAASVTTTYYSTVGVGSSAALTAAAVIAETSAAPSAVVANA